MAEPGGRPVRVAVVASVVARHDAISMAARDTARAFRDAGGFEVSLFTTRSDLPELGAHRVRGAAALRAHPALRAADVLIHHFGIFNPIFDGVAARERKAPEIVVFHNVTPSEYVAPDQRPVVERSLRQLATFRHADRFWAVSPTNLEALAALGMDREKIELIPLAVERPGLATLAGKPAAPIRLLFVGRLVRSKGVLDLIEAIDIARARVPIPFGLDIAGNEEFSDATYVRAVKAAVAERGLSGVVRFLGAVDDARLEALYHEAHLIAVPSYHEGFCRPVVEGLRAGCVPVGYAAHNLPLIAHGLGRMVQTGDPKALGSALAEVITTLAERSVGADVRSLRLDGGVLSVPTFDHAARRYVEDFAFERVSAQMVRSVRRLLSR